jgi:hypothetical protein
LYYSKLISSAIKHLLKALRRSPSPRQSELRKSLDERPQNTSAEKQKPHRPDSFGAYEASSPFKNPDSDIEIISNPNLQQPQITLKISRSSFDPNSPVKNIQSKNEKKKNKSLKIVINKKLVMNESVETAVDNRVHELSERNDDDAKATIVMDSDGFTEFEDRDDDNVAPSPNPTDSEEVGSVSGLDTGNICNNSFQYLYGL